MTPALRGGTTSQCDSETHRMPASRLKFESLPHAIFLQRVSGPQGATSLEARLGQGAFLALRLVDLLAPDRPQVSADAFRYQWVATDRFCAELRAAATEGAHVHGIAESSADAQRLGDIRLVAPALFAYAHFLEEELRLDEAIDVLTTLLVVVASRLSAQDAVAARLRLARVHRKLNRFDEAEAAYAEAGEMASAAGDRYSALLARIGLANTILGRGNLAEAAARLRGILADARAAGERDVEARAQHGIGVALQLMGQSADAIPHTWHAFQLYEEEDSRLRALGDVGIMMLTLGDAAGAERALTEVVRRSGTQESLTNALVELMHCARCLSPSRSSPSEVADRLLAGVAVVHIAAVAGAGGVGTRDGRESERDDEQSEEGANTGHVNLRNRGVVSTQQDITNLGAGASVF